MKSKLKTKIQLLTPAGHTARFYGFECLDNLAIEKKDVDVTKNFYHEYFPEEKSVIFRKYIEEKTWPGAQPALLFYDRPIHGSGHPKKSNKMECALFTIGSPRSVCECLSIEVAISILEDAGFKDLLLKINSMGDKESSTDFSRKLSAHIRKNFGSYPSELKQELKKDVFFLVKNKEEKWSKFREDCPKSLDFLTEQSRNHFKEVLEFIETMNINYEIDNSIIGDPEYVSESVFSIISSKTGDILAEGFRFNRMAKKIGHKKDIPATCINISAKVKKAVVKTKIKKIEPKAYLVQFGPEAKLKSYILLKDPYKHKVQIIHSIAKDKLGGQIGSAEMSIAPFIVLIGQKEALENSAILRNTKTRAQELLLISDLSQRLKKI